MTSKDIALHREARLRILAGVNTLADAVKLTLGPRGRNVALERSWGAPIVTKDGVTVARDIELEGKLENIGAQMVREVASRTSDETGDGTTTATVLAQTLYQNGLRLVEAGVNVMELKRGIDRATAAVVQGLREQAKVVSGRQEVRHIALVSANGDELVADFIAEAMDEVGRDGVITVEQAQGLETSVDIVEGMQLDRGYVSPYFVTDPEHMRAVLEDAYVLIAEKKIGAMADLIPTLEGVAQTSASLLVIAEDVEGEALATLVINKLRGVLKVVAVKAPGFGDNRTEMLKDLAILTGATPFLETLGRTLESATLHDLGRVRRAIVDKDETTLVGGQGDTAQVRSRIEQIRRALEETDGEYERQKLQERLAKLSGGVAVIRVGGHSEIEVKERKDRVEDALNATRAAVEEGYVPGGGVALVRAAAAARRIALEDPDQRLGARLVAEAVEAPLLQIVENAGQQGGVVLNEVRTKDGAYGYDARAEQYVDLEAAGILDPLKVVRTALENASSIAGLMLMTEAVITEHPQPEAPADGGGGMGMGDYPLG